MSAKCTITEIPSSTNLYEFNRYLVECDSCDWYQPTLGLNLARREEGEHLYYKHPRHDWRYGIPRLSGRGLPRVAVGAAYLAWLVCFVAVALVALVVAGLSWLFLPRTREVEG